MARVIVTPQSAPAGGGLFELSDVTLGVFLNDQPEHRLSVGGARAEARPLRRHEGWILPASADGLCAFDRPLDFIAVSVDDTALAEAGATPRADFAPILGAVDPALLGLALGAEAFAAGGALYRETMHRAVAAQLLQVISPPRPEAVDIDDARLRRVLDYIHAHLADDLTLAAMADLAAMSATHFSKAFKAATGRSPLQYVIRARLDLASVLLRSTRLPVAEIGYRVGYHDLSRFGRHFKRQFGAAPAAFRAG